MLEALASAALQSPRAMHECVGYSKVKLTSTLHQSQVSSIPYFKILSNGVCSLTIPTPFKTTHAFCMRVMVPCPLPVVS